MKNKIKDYVDFYQDLKSLRTKYRAMFNGDYTPDLPVLFTEGLCRELFNLNEVATREYDAVGSDGERIEIKATSNKYGQTTMNKYASFDYLYWMYYDFDTDMVTVCQFPYNKFEDKLMKKDETSEEANQDDKGEKEPRINIRLSKYKNGEYSEVMFRIGESEIHPIR